MPDRQLWQWQWEWECGNGKRGSFGREVLAAKGRFKGSKGSEGGPNCSTSQTSDRRTILAQLRHPKVRKHTPAPLEPPPASTNAVGRVTTSTKKDLGDALISPLAIHPHEPKAAQNDLAHASFVPTEPPPQRQRPPSHISVQQHYPTRQGQKVSEKPVLPVPTSPVAAIASIKQQHPHLIACPEFFLSSISPSPSLSIPRQPLVCRPLPPLIPPPPLQAHTTAIMGYSDADKLAINTIRVLAVRITPHPSILPRGFTPPPPFRWCCCSAPPSMEGGQKKRDNGVLCIEPRQCAGWDEDAVNGMRSCSPFSCHRPMPPHMPTPATQARQCKKPRRAPMPAGSH